MSICVLKREKKENENITVIKLGGGGRNGWMGKFVGKK